MRGGKGIELALLCEETATKHKETYHTTSNHIFLGFMGRHGRKVAGEKERGLNKSVRWGKELKFENVRQVNPHALKVIAFFCKSST